MLNYLTPSSDLDSYPPELVPFEPYERVWCVQLVPPRLICAETLKPSQVDYCNYWLIKWNCGTRFLREDDYTNWWGSLSIRLPYSNS